MSTIQPLPSSATTSFDATSPVVDAGDLGAEIAALAIRTGDAERSTAHAQRNLDEAAQSRADDAQVQAMHDEASSMRTQAWVSGAVGVAGACVAAGCATTGVSSTWGVVGSDVSSASGKMVDGLFGAAQHDEEASAAQDKAAADRAASDAKNASDAANDAGATVQAALDFARGYVVTEAQTQSAALHRA